MSCFELIGLVNPILNAMHKYIYSLENKLLSCWPFIMCVNVAGMGNLQG